MPNQALIVNKLWKISLKAKKNQESFVTGLIELQFELQSKFFKQWK